METITLLLVDDEQEFREATAQALGRRGFSVKQAASGKQALEVLAAGLPDLVILDLRMEGMDGMETLKAIRQLHGDLPVIILTGHGGFEDAVSGIKLRIVDFLQKPVDVEQLGRHVRSLVAKGHGRPLREKSIEELMIPLDSYTRVDEHLSVREVVRVLRDSLLSSSTVKITEQGHRSILVYGKDSSFRGLLRIGDILDLVLPDFLKASPYTTYFTGMFLARAKLIGNLEVSELLEDIVSIDIKAPLMEAVALMASHSLINLPVTRDGEVVGVLRDKDIIIEVAELLGMSS